MKDMEINTVMHNSLCISNTVEKHFDLIFKKKIQLIH